MLLTWIKNQTDTFSTTPSELVYLHFLDDGRACTRLRILMSLHTVSLTHKKCLNNTGTQEEKVSTEKNRLASYDIKWRTPSTKHHTWAGPTAVGGEVLNFAHLSASLRLLSRAIRALHVNP